MPQDRFIGVWRLVTVETVYADGERIATFQEPQGILMYEPNHIMAVQISGAYTDEALNKSATLPSMPRLQGKIPTFRAYWGRYMINAEQQMVAHHILGGSEHISGIEERSFTFLEDTLVLSMQDKPWLPAGSSVQVTWQKWA